jgi:Gpi18-like mannosyltransferase
MAPPSFNVAWLKSDIVRGVLVRAVLTVSAVVIVLGVWHHLLPSFGPLTYQYQATAPQVGALPLSVPSMGDELQVHTTITLSAVHPVLFSLVPDDCLESLDVNGQPVLFRAPVCLNDPAAVWLGGQVHAGPNTVDMRIKDIGGKGGVGLGVSAADPVFLLFMAVAFVACAAYAAYLVGLVGGRRAALAILAIVVVGLAVRLPFLLSNGYPFDARLISRWAKSAVLWGVGASYVRQIPDTMLPNYPPVALLIFAGAGHAYQWLLSPVYDVDLPDCLAFMKLPSVIADVVTSVILFFVVRRLRGTVLVAAAAGLAYALQPAVLYESAVWGQVDSLYALAALAALVAAACRRWMLMGALTAVALMTKLQAMVILPTVAMLCVLERRALIRAALGGTLTVLMLLVPLWSKPTLQAILDGYVVSTHYFPVLSMYAYNFWVALYGLPASVKDLDSGLLFGVISYRNFGLTVFASFALVLPLLFLRRIRAAIHEPALGWIIFAVPAVTTYAFFLFNTEMHERYLFLLMPLGLPLALRSRRGLLCYAAASALFFLNLVGVLPWTAADRALFAEFHELPAFIGACHLLVFGLMLGAMRRGRSRGTVGGYG